jgi:hypothetical protein
LDSSTRFNLSFDGSAPIRAERGLKLRLPFTSVTVENTTAAAITVTLLIGDGDIEDLRPLTRPASPVVGLTLWNAAVGNNGVVANSPLIEGANPDRYELTVYCPATNAAPVYVASGITGPAKSIAIIPPGVQIKLLFSGPLYLYAQNLTDQAFACATYYA